MRKTTEATNVIRPPVSPMPLHQSNFSNLNEFLVYIAMNYSITASSGEIEVEDGDPLFTLAARLSPKNQAVVYPDDLSLSRVGYVPTSLKDEEQIDMWENE